MAEPRVVIVGAGPAGVRAAETLVAAGLRPAVIDEGFSAGGQIYRRPPDGQAGDYARRYGADADRARRLHGAFDALTGRIDYRPETLAWNVRDGRIFLARGSEGDVLPYDALLLATGATDRLVALPGWTLPGCYSLGGAQIALKAHGCGVGRRVVFLGSGPLLYLVAWQYMKAGVEVAAVLDTAPPGAQLRALPGLAARPEFLLRGARFRAALALRGVEVRTGVRPLAVNGDGRVEGVTWVDARGRRRSTAADAAALGFHLRSETQLADLAGCPFLFDPSLNQWVPARDETGRTPAAQLYLAGDGARVLGADAAELGGRLAALALLQDLGQPVDANAMAALKASMQRFERFRQGLAVAFPWPSWLARATPDEVPVCRCERITAQELRDTANLKGAPELNRAKALSRIGMGRCQGRFCGPTAAEVLAEACGSSLEAVGRLRGQAPVKPLPIALRMREGAE